MRRVLLTALGLTLGAWLFQGPVEPDHPGIAALEHPASALHSEVARDGGATQDGARAASGRSSHTVDRGSPAQAAPIPSRAGSLHTLFGGPDKGVARAGHRPVGPDPHGRRGVRPVSVGVLGTFRSAQRQIDVYARPPPVQTLSS